MRRSVEIAGSLGLLCLTGPVILLLMLLVWLQDGRSPLYIAERSGRGGVPFRMVKLRSMVAAADRTGVNSTAADDPRITAVGRFIRRFKLDELLQLWNVLKGDMSLVGPRPNLPQETARYTPTEKRLLDVRPGITDFASIVFSDEGQILAGTSDPDAAYERLIRPWKSRLALMYVDHRSFRLDVRILWLTAVAILYKPVALTGITRTLEKIGAPADVIATASRTQPLQPFAFANSAKNNQELNAARD